MPVLQLWMLLNELGVDTVALNLHFELSTCSTINKLIQAQYSTSLLLHVAQQQATCTSCCINVSTTPPATTPCNGGFTDFCSMLYNQFSPKNNPWWARSSYPWQVVVVMTVGKALMSMLPNKVKQYDPKVFSSVSIVRWPNGSSIILPIATLKTLLVTLPQSIVM